MKLPHRTASRRIVVTASLCLAAGACAQEAITSATTTVVAPILRESGPQSQSTPPAPKGAFFQYGNVSFHPHFSSLWSHSTGLPAGDGKNVDSSTSTYSAGVRVDAGQHWTLDYTPTWTFFSTGSLKDTVDHAVRLSGAGAVQDWQVQVGENYGSSSSILFETGRQTKQTNSSTQLQAGTHFAS